MTAPVAVCGLVTPGRVPGQQQGRAGDPGSLHTGDRVAGRRPTAARATMSAQAAGECSRASS
ncbi:hypothetical protein [Streptomyces badius]